MIIILTYLLQVLPQDHFFRWLEEFSWKSVYLDFSVKNFLLRNFFQYLSPLLILPIDLLKRNNFPFIHKLHYSYSNWSFYSRFVYGLEWGLRQLSMFCFVFAVKILKIFCICYLFSVLCWKYLFANIVKRILKHTKSEFSKTKKTSFLQSKFTVQ